MKGQSVTHVLRNTRVTYRLRKDSGYLSLRKDTARCFGPLCRPRSSAQSGCALGSSPRVALLQILSRGRSSLNRSPWGGPGCSRGSDRYADRHAPPALRGSGGLVRHSIATEPPSESSARNFQPAGTPPRSAQTAAKYASRSCDLSVDTSQATPTDLVTRGETALGSPFLHTLKLSEWNPLLQPRRLSGPANLRNNIAVEGRRRPRRSRPRRSRAGGFDPGDKKSWSAVCTRVHERRRERGGERDGVQVRRHRAPMEGRWQGALLHHAGRRDSLGSCERSPRIGGRLADDLMGALFFVVSDGREQPPGCLRGRIRAPGPSGGGRLQDARRSDASRRYGRDSFT